MKPAPAEDPALPSWRWPIALGAIMTVVLHVPVLWENVLWVAVCGSFGITGLFCGVLPGWLAMRRDPEPSLSSGFAVSFITAHTIMATNISKTRLLFISTPSGLLAKQASGFDKQHQYHDQEDDHG